MRLAAGAVWLAYAVLLALAILPILTTSLPPLFDYPNHLARMHLLERGGDAFYAVRWRLLPNLAEDLIVPPLSIVIGLDRAARLFLVLTMAVLAAGPLLIARALTGYWSGWALSGFLMLYSRTMLWGFLNYMFGLGIALCGAACWLLMEGRPWRIRLPIAAGIATVTWFAHIEAFGCYALMIAGFELATAWRDHNRRRAITRLVVAATQFVPPILLLLGAPSAGSGGGWHYANIGRKADLIFSVFDNYDRPFDIGCFAALILLLVALGATRSLRFEARGAAALGLLFLAYLVLPSQLFSGSGADHRLPVALFLLLFGVSQPLWTPRPMAAVAIAMAGLFTFRMGFVATFWQAADRIYAADLALIDKLPNGARLAVAYPADALNMVPVPETHIPALAVIRRQAFVPTLFAYASQQPIALRAAYAPGADTATPGALWQAFTGGGKPAPDLVKALEGFDYAVFLGRGVAAIDPGACFTPMGATLTFRLFRIDATACTPAP